MTNGTAAALEAFCNTTLDEHLARRAHADAGALARDLFQRAARRVPAYRSFLRDAGLDPASVSTLEDFQRVPTVDKETYLRRHALPELCWDGSLDGSDTIAFSSGSTGAPFYFPRSARHELEVAWRFEQVFRDSFGADRRSTLAVVCFPLGTWVGGMFTAACLRFLAAKGYPLLVVTPGNQPSEILRAVGELGPLYQQVVLLGYPPFLKDVVDAGTAQGLDWSRHAVRFVMAGEVVSEAWRDIVLERTGGVDALCASASLYGTADAGVLGNETPLAIGIRRLAAERSDFAQALFGDKRLPTLVQYEPTSRFFEQVDERLVFTGEGGGIPLVRYAIGDRGGVISYAEMLERVRAWGLDPLAAVRTSAAPVREQPFVWVFGRSHHAVSIYGANVFVEMVRLGLERADVREQVSGKFVMEVVEDAVGDKELTVDVELARGVHPDGVDVPRIAHAVRDEVLAASGEFAAYVPRARQTPRVRVWPHAHPDHFPVGVKHRYVRGG
jgi:phenylacetate-CoA ligase